MAVMFAQEESADNSRVSTVLGGSGNLTAVHSMSVVHRNTASTESGAAQESEHSISSQPESDELSQSQSPSSQSFATVVRRMPDMCLQDILQEGMNCITLGPSHGDCFQGWCTMIARWQALRENGQHTVHYQPRCRLPPNTGSAQQRANPFNFSEVAFLETTKHCSLKFRDALLRMMRNQHFNARAIGWNSIKPMVEVSLNIAQVELCETRIESRENALQLQP
jgi:hypothetical protein